MTPINRLADRSLALAIAAFALLTPPVILMFNAPVIIVGLPLLHIYCFTVWLGAIVLGGRLAMRLRAIDEGMTPPDPTRPTNVDG